MHIMNAMHDINQCNVTVLFQSCIP